MIKINLFLIESEMDSRHNILPSQDFGYSMIEAVKFQNWYEQSNTYDYRLIRDMSFKSSLAGAPEREHYNYLHTNCIPVGSVEFCLAWYRKIGIQNIKPLNIPKELWKYAGRDVFISNTTYNPNQYYFMKDMDNIKAPHNGQIKGETHIKDGKMFFTEWVDNIVSEWRVFVLNKKVFGIKCYSGDEWILPSKEFIKGIVKEYDKGSYTLDIMVDSNSKNYIVELHDFFACGLYGFDDYTNIIKMMKRTQTDLLALKNNKVEVI